MNKIKYLIIALFTVGFAKGQELPQVIPPSPEATQLAKFVDMPVSLYGGTPNINFPFYTIRSGGVEIPISISYHAKGIQVAEKASRVGLGWTLNAGGVITRQVRGKFDESQYGYYTQNYASDFIADSNKRANLFWQDANNYADFYPDLFVFNFMGYSGKFIIDHVTKEPVLQSYSDLKVEFNFDGSFEYFKITTPDGNEFYFGTTTKDIVYNRSTYKYSASSQGHESINNENVNYFDSWYLDKIITFKKEEINFSYDTEEVYYNDINEVNKTSSNVKFLTYTTTHVYQNQLKQISFSRGKVLFNKSTTGLREDLYGGKKLDNIEVYSKKDSLNNIYELIKKVNFKHQYTTSNDGNLETVCHLLKPGVGVNNLGYYDTKRLFLEEIEEVNTLDSIKKNVTTFEYSEVLLPNRHSNATDNWGYYNEKNNHYLNVFTDAERVVDEVKSEAGMLKKINYPTGGSTEFIYEQNKVIPPLYFKDLLISYNNPFITKTTGIFKNPNLYDVGTNAYYHSFHVERKSVINFNVSFDNNGCVVDGPVASTCIYNVFITNQTGIPIYQLVLGNSNMIDLYSGDYMIKVEPNHRGDHDPADFEQYPFQVVGTWQEQEIPDSQELLAAGKRIKEIIKDDGLGNVIRKKYEYVDEQGLCSGKTFSIPPFFNLISVGDQDFGLGNETTNGGSGAMGNFTGNNLGYSMVTETQIGSEQNIKTIHNFTNFDNQGEFYKMPYHLPTDLEWARGLPKETKYFKYENGAYTLVKRVLNHYTFFDECITPIGINLDECLADPNNPSPTLPEYLVNKSRVKIPFYKFGGYWEGYDKLPCEIDVDCYRTAYFIGGRFNLSQREEFNYLDSNLIYLQTNFNYESNNHYQQTSEITTTSNNEILETQYFYAHDLPSVVNDSLVAKNMVGIPLKTEVKRNTELLSTQETVYKDWGNNYFAPEVVKASKGADTPEVRVKYNLVDNTNGNPLEIQQEEGMLISYIWGYNKTQPVAKLENVAYGSIPSSHLTAIETASDTNDEANLKMVLNALRNDPALANAMITTFTYKPLIGVSSITDPKGNTTTYHYDGFGRLQFVKDKDGNILSENDYHYRAQN